MWKDLILRLSNNDIDELLSELAEERRRRTIKKISEQNLNDLEPTIDEMWECVQNNKIAAVKRYKSRLNCSLRVALDIIDTRFNEFVNFFPPPKGWHPT